MFSHVRAIFHALFTTSPRETTYLIPLDAYEVANLLQLMRLTTAGAHFDADTGDWHAQIRYKLEKLGVDRPPNVSDWDLMNRMANAYHRGDR